MKGSQHEITTLSQLGGFHDLPEVESFIVKSKSVGPTYTSGVNITGPILIYGTQTIVDPSWIQFITSAYEQNMFAGVKDGSAPDTVPYLQATPERIALILAIIDQESKFGQMGIAISGGNYPSPNARWTMNRAGCIGPMQIRLSVSSYGNRVSQDPEANVHAGVHHLYQYANWRTSAAPQNHDPRFPEFKWSIPWVLAAYNWGIGNRIKGGRMPRETTNYIDQIWNKKFHWYLSQLTNPATQQSSITKFSSAVVGGSVPELQRLKTVPRDRKPGGCVRAARDLLGALDKKLVASILPSITSVTAGKKLKPGEARDGALRLWDYKWAHEPLPHGWVKVDPPSAIRNGIAFAKAASNYARPYGHVFWVIDGKAYDNNGSGLALNSAVQLTPVGAIARPEWPQGPGARLIDGKTTTRATTVTPGPSTNPRTYGREFTGPQALDMPRIVGGFQSSGRTTWSR